MKHLIIYAHPNDTSINHSLKETVVQTLSVAGHEVVVRDLYALNFNPVLSLEDMKGQRAGTVSEDVKTEQNYISWADAITFIHPIWWTGLPAIMKGYIDRVMSYNFAYSYDTGIQLGLLKDKQAYIINTHGKTHAEYKANGLGPAIALMADIGMYTYCGFEIKQHFFFDGADRADAEKIEHWQQEIIRAYN